MKSIDILNSQVSQEEHHILNYALRNQILPVLIHPFFHQITAALAFDTQKTMLSAKKDVKLRLQQAKNDANHLKRKKTVIPNGTYITEFGYLYRLHKCLEAFKYAPVLLGESSDALDLTLDLLRTDFKLSGPILFYLTKYASPEPESYTWEDLANAVSSIYPTKLIVLGQYTNLNKQAIPVGCVPGFQNNMQRRLSNSDINIVASPITYPNYSN